MVLINFSLDAAAADKEHMTKTWAARLVTVGAAIALGAEEKFGSIGNHFLDEESLLALRNASLAQVLTEGDDGVAKGRFIG